VGVMAFESAEVTTVEVGEEIVVFAIVEAGALFEVVKVGALEVAKGIILQDKDKVNIDTNIINSVSLCPCLIAFSFPFTHSYTNIN
jgi:hypothetical protein